MDWPWIFLIIALVYIGFDYGRLLLRQKKEDLFYEPTRYFMFAAEADGHMQALYRLDIQTHSAAGIEVCRKEIKEGYQKVIFENGDELLMYEYGKAPILHLTQQEVSHYRQRLFFDHKLPIGAERAIIEQLGLVNFMIDIGICREDEKENDE